MHDPHRWAVVLDEAPNPDFQAAVARTSEPPPLYPSWALAQRYERIAGIDLSHQTFQFHVADLQVMVAPRCGWSDLGTPDEVIKRVKLLAAHPGHFKDPKSKTAILDLANAGGRMPMPECAGRAQAPGEG